MDKPDNVIADFKVRYEKCPECENGFKLELDGDGYGSEVICDRCMGTGKIEVWY